VVCMSHRWFWNADCSSLLRATVRRVLSQQATPLIREPQQHLFAPSALAGNELQMAAGVTCSHLQELQLGSQHCNSWAVSTATAGQSALQQLDSQPLAAAAAGATAGQGALATSGQPACSSRSDTACSVRMRAQHKPWVGGCSGVFHQRMQAPQTDNFSPLCSALPLRACLQARRVAASAS
jgi:hypothetical protein